MTATTFVVVSRSDSAINRHAISDKPTSTNMNTSSQKDTRSPERIKRDEERAKCKHATEIDMQAPEHRIGKRHADRSRAATGEQILMDTPIEFLALTTEDVNIRVRLFGRGRRWHTARAARKADQRDANFMAAVARDWRGEMNRDVLAFHGLDRESLREALTR